MRNTTYEFYTIGAVDPDYKHVWGFSSKAERETFLAAHLKKTITNNTYWRPVDHTIKADFTTPSMPSYETSYTYDYVRVTNRDDEGAEQVYYLFVVDRSYININLTEIVVVPDYIQTYYFVGNVPFWSCSGYCVSSNNLSLMPPRGAGSEYPVTAYENIWRTVTSTRDNVGFIVYSTISIGCTFDGDNYDWDYDFTDEDNPDIMPFGDLAQYMYMGSFPYIVNAGSTVANCTHLRYLNEALNRAGQLASITGIYAVPAGLLPAFKSGQTNRIIGAYRYSTNLMETFRITLPSADTLFTQRGLTVTNPVLKGYEYTKITVSNMSGEEVEYHYEDFTGQPQFAYTLSLDAGYPVQIMYPINYKYGASAIEQMYATKQTNPPQASLSSDNYAIWQAQNRNSIQASLDASKLTLANAQEVRSKTGGIASALDNLFDSAKSGITDMLGSMGMALPEGASDALTTAGYSGLNSLLSMGFLQSFGLEASYVYDQQVNVAMQGLRNVEASFKDQSYLPASVHGSNAYGDLLLMNQFGFMIIITAPDAANLAKLDLDMEANGHMVGLLATVGRTRTRFDYCRMLDAKIPNAPNERPYFVNQMMVKYFSDGLYLWWMNYDSQQEQLFSHPYNTLNNPV